MATMTAMSRTKSLSFVYLLLYIYPSAALSSIPSPSNKSCPDLKIDATELQHNIYHGRVHQVHDFLTESEVQLLLEEMDQLDFTRSGLSNTNKGASQGFGNQDRYLSVVPWWDQVVGANEAPSHIQKLRQLQLLLSTVLDRPTMLSVNHECYYSKSLPNSSLARHMDERHEELKGAKGWLLPSRRSISWLIYLSDEPWDLNNNGGALRSFSPKNTSGQKSTHKGNLQVGWMTLNDERSRPVYLDSWFAFSADETTAPEPHCILYIVNDDETIKYVSFPWLNDATGMSTADFILKHKDKLILDHSSHDFSLVEDRNLWESGEDPEHTEAIDSVPARRSLVMFDSVCVPHEVELIHSGTRRALAGWFHEATQEIPPEWYG